MNSDNKRHWSTNIREQFLGKYGNKNMLPDERIEHGSNGVNALRNNRKARSANNEATFEKGTSKHGQNLREIERGEERREVDIAEWR